MPSFDELKFDLGLRRAQRQLARAFGLTVSGAIRLENPAAPAGHVTSYAWIGLPDLFNASFFLTAASSRWLVQQRRLAFPRRCCMCRAPATLLLANATRAAFGALHVPGRIEACIPHCSAHGARRRPRIQVSAGNWGDDAWQVNILGTDREFLAHTVELNMIGEPLPPWRAFTALSPFTSAFRQGNGELWWRELWSPFWFQLSKAAQRAYLARSAAPEEWLEYFEMVPWAADHQPPRDTPALLLG